MPILTPPDTAEALGLGFAECESRSLLKDKFIFHAEGFDAAKRVAIDLYLPGGREDISEIHGESEKVRNTHQNYKTAKDDRFNTNKLRDAEEKIRLIEYFANTPPERIPATRAWLDSIPEERRLIFKLTTASNLLVGLANGVLENAGCTLHSRFGFPVIPGAALKGVARDAAAALGLNSETLLKLFGSGADDDEGFRGGIAFLDGWAQVEAGDDLSLDVATPHFGDYYSGRSNPSALDEELPVPIVFPAVAPGVIFEFPLVVFDPRLTDPEATDLLKGAKRCLESALVHLGVGAKTASGYGRFHPELRIADTLHHDLFPLPIRAIEDSVIKKWSTRVIGTMVLKGFINDLLEIDDDATLRVVFDQLIPAGQLANFRTANPFWRDFIRGENAATLLARLGRTLD